MSPDERAALIDELIDGAISEADFLRLEAEFSIDPQARRDYYNRLILTAALENEARSERIKDGHKARPARSKLLVVVGFMGSLAAAAAVVSMLMVADKGQADRDDVAIGSPVEQRASGFAVVTGQVDTQWGDGGHSPVDGALVPAGLLELKKGVAQLELFSGVMVVVEAPAAFEIVSSMEMVVTQGRVRAHVPEPAHGFRIRTVDGEIVDLGTEFALNVSQSRSEVHVLDGEIEWNSNVDTSVPVRRMSEGEAVRASVATGETVNIAADAQEFLGIAELRERLASNRTSRQERWESVSLRLQNDSRVVAYYRTGSRAGWNRRVPNIAQYGVGGEGAIVAAVDSADRWGQPGGALDFSPTGSRVRMTIPGEYRSLTLLTWVKINSLDRWYNSLFLTDGHELNEPHWQIMDDGRLFFSVKKNDQWDVAKGQRDKHIFYSPSFWEPALSGQWTMIATTYDVDARKVVHYLNGKSLSSETIPDEYLVETVQIGNASLGNWSLPENDDPHFAVRNLNGSMDSFMLFRVALTPQEISEIYESGRP
ncbi:MAG: FecR domain-containing protein [Verrucomicrobiae bacterium]|nr:FecR domain-containing protein [Verrucomicrobiae bacterium]